MYYKEEHGNGKIPEADLLVKNVSCFGVCASHFFFCVRAVVGIVVALCLRCKLLLCVSLLAMII